MLINPAMNALTVTGISSDPAGPLPVTATAGDRAGQAAAAGGEFSNLFQAAQGREDRQSGTQDGPRGNSPRLRSASKTDTGEQPPLAAVPLNLPALSAALHMSAPFLPKATVTDAKSDRAPALPGEKARGEKAHEEKRPKNHAVAHAVTTDAPSAAPVPAPTAQLTQNAMLVPAPVVPLLPGPAPALSNTSAPLAKGETLQAKGGNALSLSALDLFDRQRSFSARATLAPNAALPAPPASPQQKAEAAEPAAESVPGALKGESAGGEAGKAPPAAGLTSRPTATSGPSAGPSAGPPVGPMPGAVLGKVPDESKSAAATSDSKPADPAATHDTPRQPKDATANASAVVRSTSALPGQIPQASTAPGLGQTSLAAAPAHEPPIVPARLDVPPGSPSAAAAIGNADPHALLDSGGALSDAAREAAWQFSPNRIEAGFTSAQNSWISVVAARQDGHLTASLQSSSPADGSALQSLLPQLNAHLAVRQMQLDAIGVSVRQDFSPGGGAGGGEQAQRPTHAGFSLRQPSSASVETALTSAVFAAGRISLRA